MSSRRGNEGGCRVWYAALTLQKQADDENPRRDQEKRARAASSDRGFDESERPGVVISSLNLLRRGKLKAVEGLWL
jgi:hypothetical protein